MADRAGAERARTERAGAERAGADRMAAGPRRVRRIGDYALLGDGHTAALVGIDGSVDWLCLPRFDSGAVFAALLGDDENGHWRIAPREPGARASRAYRPGTLILETVWRAEGGTARVIDFMTPYDGHADVVRIVEGMEGRVAFDLDLTMRLDYGRTVPWVRSAGPGILTAVAGPHMMILRATAEIVGQDMHSRARFDVGPGERHVFRLTHQDSWLPLDDEVDPVAALDHAHRFWTGFSEGCPPAGRWSEAVRRSLITLKALIYEPTGGIVAAPTTSLPETPGGTRNWDYRYCWLRDASLTLMAFLELGHIGEATAWRDWLLRAVAGDPRQMQIMYGVAGERALVEWEAGWLPGFRGSRPVRIGNAAAEQFQLDVYGEVAEMLVMARRAGMAPHPDAPNLLGAILPFLETAWREPDDGIWEMRAERRHFVHSKVMAWVAFDRAAALEAEAGDPEGLAARWRAAADAIHADVCEKGFSAQENSFVQSYGSRAIDASLLHIVLTGFLPPDDPRAVGTVEAVERHLVRGGFVERYDVEASDDGVSRAEEGAFLICTFWLVDALVLIGRRDDAEALFERAVGVANDVGLLAEEYDPVSGEMLGNFPQAFSHVGLILSALNLARTAGPAGKRAAQGEEGAGALAAE